VALVERSLDSGLGFPEAIRIGLQAVLCSPEFLFVGEPDQRPGEPLTDWALASRLSYFLWSSMPDRALLTNGRKQRREDMAFLS
jgi:hypothetical protein